MSELEMREAARFNGYTWREWLMRSYEERIDDVAYARVARLIDLNAQDAQVKQQEAESKRQSHRGR